MKLVWSPIDGVCLTPQAEFERAYAMSFRNLGEGYHFAHARALLAVILSKAHREAKGIAWRAAVVHLRLEIAAPAEQQPFLAVFDATKFGVHAINRLREGWPL